MKRIFTISSTILLALALIIVAVPFFLTADFVGEQLQQVVADKTGRTLTIKGPLRFKFWPRLVVEANNVALSDPPDMGSGTFAAIEKMRIGVAAMPLLSRNVEVKEITLIKPVLSMVVGANGRANWDFEQPGKAGSTGKTSSGAPAPAPARGKQSDIVSINAIKLAPITIKNGSFRFLDQRSGKTFSASEVNSTITMNSFPGPVNVKGTLVWNKQPVRLAVYVKSPSAVSIAGSAADLSLQSPMLTAQFSGRLRIREGLGLAGTIKASTPSLRDLAKWTGNKLAPGRGLAAFSVASAIDLSGKTIKLTKAKVAIDGMNAQGSVTVRLGGKRPEIRANIGMDKIDANIYLAKDTASDKSAKTGKAAPQTVKAASSGWSDRRIDFSGLKAVDADLSINTGKIIYKQTIIGHTQLRTVLKNGVLDANLSKMAFYDGQATGRLILDGNKAKPVIRGALNASGLNALRLLKDFAGMKRLSGTAMIKLSLAATGRSQRELVSTLGGTSSFKFTNGAVRGIDIAGMIRNVESKILGGWKKTKQRDTDFSVLSTSFNIKNGVAKSDDLRLLGPLVRVKGGGEIDLLRRYIDYRVKPKLVASLEGQGGKQKLKGLSVPIIIKGPWAKPKIYPDIKGILDNPQAAYDKLRKLIGQGKDIDLKKQGKKLEKKFSKKAEKIIDKTVTKNAKKILGDEAGEKLGKKTKKLLGKKGKKLLKGLFGN